MTYAIQKYKANRDGSDFYGACQLRFGFKNGSSSDYQKQFETHLSVIYSFAIFQ